MTWLQTIVMLLGGAASAASLSESISRGAERRREKAALRRGSVDPKDAARELEHRVGGRVGVGIDRDTGEYRLVIMRRRKGIPVPRTFAGFPVIMQPKLTLHED